ncbi:hypothetical protein E2C01_096269 [Portunus trituberculatus]|uniref:Uncharacterized protein n=1 Tax=Portunus trituberculatus TaxID=210409 RepID=A0A5B7JS77_PORTR|nr:hypothetical protein [Portunus trituberculatus]
MVILYCHSYLRSIDKKHQGVTTPGVMRHSCYKALACVHRDALIATQRYLSKRYHTHSDTGEISTSLPEGFKGQLGPLWCQGINK